MIPRLKLIIILFNYGFIDELIVCPILLVLESRGEVIVQVLGGNVMNNNAFSDNFCGCMSPFYGRHFPDKLIQSCYCVTKL